MHNRKSILLSLALLATLNGCDKSSQATNPAPLDYSLDACWLSQPQTIDKAVDVFYVYPTIYSQKEPANMDISDSALRTKAQGLLISQAGVYSPYANLFAPYYQQESMAELNNVGSGEDAYQLPAFQVGAKDVEAAFDYYLKELNPDRPFIIAGHSQGTMTLINLMRKRFNNPELQKRLVAAYLIGYTITKDDLRKYPWIKLAKGESDTGVIITYNTEGADAGSSPVLLEGAVTINPLNWKSDGTPATCEENLGAVFFDFDNGKAIEEVANFAGAYIDRQSGALIVTNMHLPKSDKIDLVNLGNWPKGIYHKYDYSFWYNNLKANVKNRIDAYQNQQPDSDDL